jgi:hypothetical protein
MDQHFGGWWNGVFAQTLHRKFLELYLRQASFEGLFYTVSVRFAPTTPGCGAVGGLGWCLLGGDGVDAAGVAPHSETQHFPQAGWLTDPKLNAPSSTRNY